MDEIAIIVGSPIRDSFSEALATLTCTVRRPADMTPL